MALNEEVTILAKSFSTISIFVGMIIFAMAFFIVVSLMREKRLNKKSSNKRNQVRHSYIEREQEMQQMIAEAEAKFYAGMPDDPMKHAEFRRELERKDFGAELDKSQSNMIVFDEFSTHQAKSKKSADEIAGYKNAVDLELWEIEMMG